MRKGTGHEVDRSIMQVLGVVVQKCYDMFFNTWQKL